MCIYGFFCERMVDMATRIGANVVPLRAEWGKPFPEELLEQELGKHANVKMVTAIHAETSTGVRQPLEGISALAKAHDALFMVDAVTSLGGNEVAADDWDIDYCYSATQKCLGCPPGLSPVMVSPRAHDVVKSRETKPVSWYLDLALNANYWGFDRVYHHTAPVSMILALREGLRIVLEEGLEARFERHRRNADALRAGLDALGLEAVVPREHALDQITPLWIPEGVDDDTVRGMLLREHNLEIGKGPRRARRQGVARGTDGRVQQGRVRAGASVRAGGHTPSRWLRGAPRRGRRSGEHVAVVRLGGGRLRVRRGRTLTQDVPKAPSPLVGEG